MCSLLSEWCPWACGEWNISKPQRNPEQRIEIFWPLRRVFLMVSKVFCSKMRVRRRNSFQTPTLPVCSVCLRWLLRITMGLKPKLQGLSTALSASHPALPVAVWWEFNPVSGVPHQGFGPSKPSQCMCSSVTVLKLSSGVPSSGRLLSLMLSSCRCSTNVPVRGDSLPCVRLIFFFCGDNKNEGKIYCKVLYTFVLMHL